MITINAIDIYRNMASNGEPLTKPTLGGWVGSGDMPPGKIFDERRLLLKISGNYSGTLFGDWAPQPSNNRCLQSEYHI